MTIPNFREPEHQSLQPFLDWLPGEKIHLVEVGCFTGYGTIQFLRHPKIVCMTCVDLFQSGYDPGDIASSCDMSEVMKRWMENIADLDEQKPVVLFARCSLYQVVPVLKGKVDVVYIDACHLYEAVLDDIALARKLKPACIAGHDYGAPHHPDVKKAVDESFGRPYATFPDTSWAVVL